MYGVCIIYVTHEHVLLNVNKVYFLLVTSLFQILDLCDLTNYDICFVQIGENDVKAAKDDPLGLNNHACAD